MSDELPQGPAESPATTEDPSGGGARGAGETGTPAPAEPASTEQALTRERDELHDRLLRKTAEFDNYRKRVERERREQADRAVTDLLQEILLVADDFDRALAIEADESAQPYRKGVELMHAKLHELLKKHGVRPMETLGQDFDPNLHQAVAYEASPGAREGEIIDELRRGYTRHDRLLRPAMVKVARA